MGTISLGETALVASVGTMLKFILSDIYKFCRTTLKRELRVLNYQKTLEEIAKQIATLDSIRTILRPEIDVSLREMYYPARVVDYQLPVGSAPGIAVDSLREMPPHCNFIVEGTVGQGKTCFLKWLALGELSNAVAPENARVPIFVELRSIEQSLEGLLTKKLQGFSAKLHYDDLKAMGKSGRVVLLLDAFDEIPPDLQPKIATEISTLALNVPELRIVVTTRPGTPLSTCAGFRTMKLEELRTTDHTLFLAKVLNNNTIANKIMTEVRNSGVQVANLITTPLLLTLLAVLYRAENRVPPTIHEFYQHLFDTLFYRHDRMKEGFERHRRTALSESDFKKLFEALCFQSRILELGVFDKDSFRECTKLSYEVLTIPKVDPDKFREDCVRSLCLLQEEGMKYHFIHRSVQEYYAASFVKHAEEAFARKWYRAVSARQAMRFSQELAFLEEIDRGRLARYFWVPSFEDCCKNITGYDVKQERAAAIGGVLKTFAVTLAEAVEGHDRRVLRPIVLVPTSIEKYRDFLWAAIQPLLQRDLPPKSLPLQDPEVEKAKFMITFKKKGRVKATDSFEIGAVMLNKYVELGSDARQAELDFGRLINLVSDKYDGMVDATFAEKRKLGMLAALGKSRRRAQSSA